MRKATLATALCLLACLFLAGSAQAASSCAQMQQWLADGSASSAGLLVIDAESGDVLCSSAPQTPRPLASNMKLFTTSTALVKLGPEDRIATKLFADGKVDASGVLHGSLYLQGGGDPTLGTPAFYDSYLAGLGTNIYGLAAQVKAAGITAITGRLYADDTIFDRLRGVADSGYKVSSYIGPLSGLAFNSGFSGQTSSTGFSAEPAKLAASKLARKLIATGVRMPPQVALAATPANATRVGIIRSAPLSKIVNTTDVYSDNFFAEMLLKLLGAEVGSGGTTRAGAAVVSAFARSLGSGVHAVDGSGLTRSNTASPTQVVALLRAMRGEAVAEEFIDDLAIAGKEGTLAGRMRGTPAYGNCRMKTGTLTGVSNLSGYCFNPDGRTTIFSILMAHAYDTGTAHVYQDRIAGAVAGL